MPQYRIPDKARFIPKPMVGWYNVRQLITTGIKSLISSLFGSYADRREIQASISGREYFDYSGHEELWLDYTADLGDGFNPTFTVASLLAREEIRVGDHSTKRGNILILGGDMVYPVAHKIHYRERFIIPYEIAYPRNQQDASSPDLFAVPGNHDWYDGLANFLKIFINDRFIGNWRAAQHRSYFAIKLTERLWLWGIDIQLDADIDKPQIDYFEEASLKMEPGHKVILCTSKPSWIYHSTSEEESYRILEFFEENYIVKKGFELVLTLAGDSHHYARYSKEGTHKVTSGGGGAFLHPTHNLPGKIATREGEFTLKKTFPSKKNSFRLLFMNLFFPFMNPEFAAFMGLVYLFISWLLQSVTYYQPLYTTLSQIEPSWLHLSHAFNKMTTVIVYSPGLLIIILGIFFGAVAFADKNSGKVAWSYFMGILQGALHILLGLALIWILSYYCFHEKGYHLESIFIFSAAMFLSGGFMGALVLGIYLCISSLVGIHDNEAFSSLKWEGYKNFLRLHITKNKIVIFPIGLVRCVRWKVKDGYVRGNDPKPSLIEEPVVIDL